MSGLSNVAFYAACAIGVVLWLLPALILSATYAVCTRSAERAYRDGHRDGWAAADFRHGEEAAGRYSADIPMIPPTVQTDEALIGIAAQIADLAESIRRDRT